MKYNFEWIEEEVKNWKVPVTMNTLNHGVQIGLITWSYPFVDPNGEEVYNIDDYLHEREGFLKLMIEKYGKK